MPLYTFGCADCDCTTELLVDLKTAEELELICKMCAGTMTKRPVLSLNFIGEAIAARKKQREGEAEKALSKACGHTHQCRCSIRLKRPNPFKAEIRKAAGFVEDE